MKKSIVNYQRHTSKLLKIIDLNQKGINYIINKSASAIDLGLSKGEFIDCFKDDVSKTASFLFDSMPIIYSVENGRLTEINSLDNSVEGIFGPLLKDNVVTLCTIKFNLNNPIAYEKADLINMIYQNLFDINRKELSILSKAIEKYETTTDLVEKAVLYPSTLLADKLIEKVGAQDKAFSEYRKKLSFNDLNEFNITFNRSGIGEVIQQSTYISRNGVEQIIPLHKKMFMSPISHISNELKNNKLKYIEAVEVDADADVSKMLRVINQIESLKINTDYKLTLKFRKLGNYSARGLYMSNSFVLAEDINDSTAIIHELAHFVHIGTHYENEFVNKMIAKMSTMLDLGDLSNGAKKADYYSDPKEILARSLEIAALLAFEAGVATFEMWDYGLIKTRAFYESFEGIYFNFNSFDDKTIEELIELYKFFFDTSYGEPNSTYIDNFIKINTNYQRQKKDIFSIYKNISNNAKSEKKAIYSMVNGDNIKLIIDNKPLELSLEELTAKMLANLGYAGNHPARAMEEDWAKVKEDKAKVCMTLIEAFKKESSNKEYIEFLIQLQSLKVFDLLEYSVGLSGFSKMSVRTSVRKKIKELFPEGSYLSYVAWSSHCRRNVLELVEDKELLNDADLLNSYVMSQPYMASNIVEFSGVTFETALKIGSFMVENMPEKKAFIPKVCFNDYAFALAFIQKDENPDNLRYLGDKLVNNIDFIQKALSRFEGHSLWVAFHYVGIELKSDVDFMKYWINKNPDLMKFANKTTLALIDSKQEEKETIKVEEVAKPTKRKRNTKDKGDEVKVVTVQDFDEILKNAKIEDFKHTQTGEDLKVLKIEDKIEDFKSFNMYLIKNEIAYYSRYAKGFVVKNLEKLQGVAASTTALYSPEVLEVFAKGTLF